MRLALFERGGRRATSRAGGAQPRSRTRDGEAQRVARRLPRSSTRARSRASRMPQCLEAARRGRAARRGIALVVISPGIETHAGAGTGGEDVEESGTACGMLTTEIRPLIHLAAVAGVPDHETNREVEAPEKPASMSTLLTPAPGRRRAQGGPPPPNRGGQRIDRR